MTLSILLMGVLLLAHYRAVAQRPTPTNALGVPGPETTLNSNLLYSYVEDGEEYDVYEEIVVDYAPTPPAEGASQSDMDEYNAQLYEFENGGYSAYDNSIQDVDDSYTPSAPSTSTQSTSSSGDDDEEEEDDCEDEEEDCDCIEEDEECDEDDSEDTETSAQSENSGEDDEDCDDEECDEDCDENCDDDCDCDCEDGDDEECDDEEWDETILVEVVEEVEEVVVEE
jgi:hypothetical protein